FKSPVVRPCTRRFGAACLLHYYPHRCGGWNPLVMWRQYRQQSQRLRLLHRYRILLTHSEHMRQEYLKHGFAAEHLRVIPYFLPSSSVANGAAHAARRQDRAGFRLLFLGRMDRLKGGHVLLEAIPEAARRLGKPLHLTMAGDGPMR